MWKPEKMNGSPSASNVILDHVYSEVTDENRSKVLEPLLVLREETELEPQEKQPEKACPICNKVLPPHANLSFHRMLHPWTETPYSCDHCLFVCMTREELVQHCKTVHPETQKFVCGVCAKDFTNIRSLNKHKRLHNAKHLYTCAYCDKEFREYMTCRQHEVEHKTATFQCENCLVKFTTSKIHNDHCNTEYCKTKTLICCEKVFSNRLEYVEHCLLKHRRSGTKEYECEFCGKLYILGSYLSMHKAHCRLRTDKDESKAEGEVEMLVDPELTTNSMVVARRVSAAATRISVTSGGKKLLDKGKKNFKCHVCNKELSSKAWLTQHLRKHEGTSSVMTCKICNKQYSSYAAMYYHRLGAHLQIRRFKCTYCSKAFVSNQALRDHVTCHTGEQPFACHLCPKKFRHRSSKIAHLRIHTGERPYQCRYCDETFRRRYARVSHERRHTGEKPYKCRVCDRCFTQDSTWRSHERKHKPPFSCNYCSLVFSCLDTLTNHKKNHSVAVVQEQENDQAVQEVCYVMEQSAACEMESVDGTVYVQYQVA